ncbi:MAG: succinate dehydrogenase, partial [Verrucomicrobia bacterium]|nr:succinate dehydrogenase [Verrucomicrobiota bacterium]
MAQVQATLPTRQFGETTRKDAWWAQPLLVFLGLSAFIVYSTWAAFQGTNYWLEKNGANYLSPFYSPELFGESPHAWFGAKPAAWPARLPFSPALLILWIPAGFRLTCYYYRGAYYKSFWADPPSCAVGEPRKTYLGENSLPLILQNAHRYFLYLALIFILVLAHDVLKALWFADAAGKTSFGVGVGTLVLAMNVVLLGGYTFGC